MWVETHVGLNALLNGKGEEKMPVKIKKLCVVCENWYHEVEQDYSEYTPGAGYSECCLGGYWSLNERVFRDTSEYAYRKLIQSAESCPDFDLPDVFGDDSGGLDKITSNERNIDMFEVGDEVRNIHSNTDESHIITNKEIIGGNVVYQTSEPYDGVHCKFVRFDEKFAHNWKKIC